MDIGFIGIGQMGQHMAGHILKAGHNVTVNDINKEAAAGLVEKGAKWADTPGEVAKSCRVVISSLPSPKATEDIVYGENGLKSEWKEGDIFIDMSTNSPTTMQKIAGDAAKMGVAVLDAPVSGGTRGAEMATLTIMVGGDTAVLDKVRGVLETMGPNIYPVGDVGCGNVAKLINNLIALTAVSVCSEGFVLGAKAGIDPQVLHDIVTSSTGDNWVLRQFPQTVFKGEFAPMYRLGLAHKDISLAVQMGKDYQVPLPIGEIVEKKLIDADEAGHGDKHVDAVILPLEELIGVQVRTK